MEIHETIDEFGDEVIAHQKKGNEHRLVLCKRPPPQDVSEWVAHDQVAWLGPYRATWDKVEKIPF